MDKRVTKPGKPDAQHIENQSRGYWDLFQSPLIPSRVRAGQGGCSPTQAPSSAPDSYGAQQEVHIEKLHMVKHMWAATGQRNAF